MVMISNSVMSAAGSEAATPAPLASHSSGMTWDSFWKGEGPATTSKATAPILYPQCEIWWEWLHGLKERVFLLRMWLIYKGVFYSVAFKGKFIGSNATVGVLLWTASRH